MKKEGEREKEQIPCLEKVKTSIKSGIKSRFGLRALAQAMPF